jgi:hypothetical protein
MYVYEETRGYLLEWVHPEALVHARGVGEEGGECGFENETEVERPVAHALVDDRVTARLADDQIGPLHHHDGHEERGVARELKGFAVAVSLEAIENVTS